MRDLERRTWRQEQSGGGRWGGLVFRGHSVTICRTENSRELCLPFPKLSGISKGC